MEHTLALQKIINAWFTDISQSQDIKDYCTEHFHKKLKYIVGGNPRESPSEEDCPFIVVMNDNKLEGEGLDTYTYSAVIVWAISNTAMIVDGTEQPFGGYPEADTITLKGAVEVDELGQLIYEAVAKCAIDHGYPLSKVEYDLSPKASFPQFVGYMRIETEIEPTMGEILDY